MVGASIHALWELKAEAEAALLATLPDSSPFAAETAAEVAIARGRTTVAFNGSVVEQYPGYRRALQGFVDGLLVEGLGLDTKAGEGSGKGGEIALVEARESSLRGAAVALACLA